MPAQQQVEARVKNLEQIVAGLSSTARRYDVNPDAKSKGAVTNTIAEQFLDVRWDTLFSYSTEFESLDGFDTDAGVDLFGGGVRLTTAGSGADIQTIIKNTAPNLTMDLSKESRFRGTIVIDQATNQTARFSAGDADEAYGFKITNAALTGFARHLTVETTVSLNTTLAVDDVYVLEAKNYPGNKVEFFVNGAPVGAISSGLPSTSEFPTIIWSASLAEQAAAAKVMHIYSVHYLQRRV